MSTYKGAGVDVDTAAELVGQIKPLIESTRRPGVIEGDFGGFGASFDLRAARYRDPILVSGMDGVGTKTVVAEEVGVFNTVGVDVVAMCANDVVTTGAEPLYFLDFFGTAKLHPAIAHSVIEGVVEGCRIAGCALLGGETAEMPGVYCPDQFELVGTMIGVHERGAELQKQHVRSGDVLIGLHASGPHANGYSLIRRIVQELWQGDYDSLAPWNRSVTLGQELLVPTHIYSLACLKAIETHSVHSMAHITGGGLPGNVPRALPPGLGVQIEKNKLPKLPVFEWIQKTGNVDEEEMLRTFNRGIGMVLVVIGGMEDQALQALTNQSLDSCVIGRVVEGECSVRFT